MSSLRTAVKKARSASGEQAGSSQQQAERALDRAARKGIIHKNRAARLKSRLAKVPRSKADA